MNRKNMIVLSSVLVAACLANVVHAQTTVGERADGLKVLPESKLKYALSLPADYSEGRQYPLVVALHGMGDGAANFMRFWKQVFAGRSIILACPQGSRKMTRGFAWDGKDVAGINECTREIAKVHRVDQERILLTGFSMGCSMGYAAIGAHRRPTGALRALRTASQGA